MAKAKRRSAKPKTKAGQAAERRTLKALTLMRKRTSRQKEAAKARTSPRTSQKYAGDVVRVKDVHYKAKPSDAKSRRMKVLTDQGLMGAEVRGSRSAGRL